jgi:hypothetical protein
MLTKRPVQANMHDVICQQSRCVSPHRTKHEARTYLHGAVGWRLARCHDTDDTNHASGDTRTIRWTAKMIGRRTASWQPSPSRTRIMAATPLLETDGNCRVSDRRSGPGPDQSWHIQVFSCFGCTRRSPVHDFLLSDRSRNHGQTT